MSDEQSAVIESLKAAIEKAYIAGKEDAAREGVVISESDLFTFVHCSVGYALGRRSYMTELVPQLVRRYWSALPEGTRIILERNLRSDIAAYGSINGGLGDDCDAASWRNLLAWMSEQLIKGDRS